MHHCSSYTVQSVQFSVNDVKQQEDKLSFILRAHVGRGSCSGGLVWLLTLTSDNLLPLQGSESTNSMVGIYRAPAK